MGPPAAGGDGPPRGPSPPWLVGLPLFLGAVILGVLWALRREPLYGAVAVAVLAWGVLWVWGAARERRGQARASAAPPYHRPIKDEAVVLGRARLRRRGRGVLLAGDGVLLWVAGDLARLGRVGQALPLGALTAGGLETHIVAALADLESCRLQAGVIGAGTLTLRLRSGGETTLRLLDPEVTTLLLAAVAELDEAEGEG